MKQCIKPVISVVFGLLLSVLGTGQAMADHRHHHWHPGVQLGISIGPVWGYPYRWPYPYVYPPAPYVVRPPVVIASPPPTVYIERAEPPEVAAIAPAPVLEPGYWYYCQESAAYYPQVKHCAGDWHKVSPQPQPK